MLRSYSLAATPIARIGHWIYSRLDRLRRSGWSGSYLNAGGLGSAAVFRALSAAILRCTSSLDAEAGEVSASIGLPTGSRPADPVFARLRVRTKSWTPLAVTWTAHFSASISAMSRYVRPLLRSSSMNSRYGSRRERGGLIGSSARILFRSASIVASLGRSPPNYNVTPDGFLTNT